MGEDYFSSDDECLTDQENSIKKELAKIPFDQILKMKEKMGKKAFASYQSSKNAGSNNNMKQNQHEHQHQLQRKNLKGKKPKKSAPLEISSKKRPRSLMNLGGGGDAKGTMSKPHDPRFDSRCGVFVQESYDSNFDFIKKYQNSEMDDIKHKISSKRDSDGKKLSQQEIADLKSLLLSRKSHLMSEKRKERERKIIKDHKKREKEMSEKHGKQPFYLKKSEVRKIQLTEKFNDIKERRGDAAEHVLEKLMEKRRKKNAAKQKKYIPFPKREEQRGIKHH